MVRQVGFRVLVTFLGLLASLASGGVMCRRGIISTGGDFGGSVTVEGQFCFAFGNEVFVSLILLF